MFLDITDTSLSTHYTYETETEDSLKKRNIFNHCLSDSVHRLRYGNIRGKRLHVFTGGNLLKLGEHSTAIPFIMYRVKENDHERIFCGSAD